MTLAGSFYKRHAVSAAAASENARNAALRLLVSAGFQGLFHPPRGVLFTFPSRYSFAIGGQGIRPWRVVPPASHRISRAPWYSGTVDPTTPWPPVAYGTLTLSGGPFQSLRARPHRVAVCDLATTTDAALTTPAPPPRERDAWFGLIPVRSPLLRDSLLIPLPRGTEMFQFPRFPSVRLCIQRRSRPHHGRGLPHSEFDWLIARLQLPSHVSPLSAPFFGPGP